tara:strand:- start:184 stop:1074 length:891 start_codon:yes stop_codon:yes gene_type:complete
LKKGSVVQLDRISDFGSEGWGFESSLGHTIFLYFFFIINLTAQNVIFEIELPKSVYETSGLEIVHNNLITLNDSGNQPTLYYLKKNGEVFYERNFSELKNIDWEDLAVDDEFIYIADIGNNFDKRDNLRIIKVPIFDKNNSVGLINFFYPEQKDFSFKENSYYDAEGLISLENNLLIFTKNRAKKITEIYRIPKEPGNYKAKLIGQINTESIVTSADYDMKTKLLVLTSTSDFNDYYIILIENFDYSKLDNLNLKKFKIPIDKTQVEAIKIIDKNNFLITSEAETFGSPYLFKISL